MAARRNRPDPDDVDGELRRLLEPNPLAVERVVRSALAARHGHQRPTAGRWWPRLAVAAAAVALVFVLLPDPAVPPPAEPAPSTPAPSTPAPVRLSISNVEGHVSVSSTAGSRWILVPGDES